MRLLPLLLLACKGPATIVDPGTCAASDTPTAEVSQGTGWAPEDGTPVRFGTPPQGGAPYAPFEIRLLGMPYSEMYHVVLEARDLADNQVIGTEDYDQRFVCANVGENEGTRYTPELHMRFYGYEPPEIDGREVQVRIQITSDEGDAVEIRYRGALDWVLGPLPD